MPKISKLLKVFFPLLLALIALFICFRNYTPGTYLIGWDSLHPEFNFPLNISRMFSHVWASEQGVGAISAHSDMSDLPRIIFLWIASISIPASFIRYFYIFSCLIIGSLGVYSFLKYIFQREKDSYWVYPASFLGGLFYLLNLGTLQNFYVPLEMFTVAFAGVPWLFLTAIKSLRSMTRSNLVKFALVVVLITPMAYAATQAYAIYLGLFLFLFVFALTSSGKKLKLKSLLILGTVAILLNLYWVLPNIYAIAQQSLTISNANINRLFSQESFLRNADYGNLANVLIQKSFLFSWRSFDFITNQFDDLLKAWNTHLAIPGMITLGYFLAFVAFLGILVAVIKKNKTGLSLILPLVLCLFFIFNVNPPAGHFYEYLYNHFGIFREGFRTPFTKFSVLFEFILAFYFGYLCYQIFTWKIKYLAFFKILILFWFSGGIILFSLPFFSGNLVGQNVRVKLPYEYKELFSWFKDHPDGRIALMPINTKFGWEYRNLDLPAQAGLSTQVGYEGSGFLTYGIPNPVLYRDFDRWNSANEDFYNQAAFALYAKNTQSFISTLKKFNVKYLLLDESITNPGGSESLLKIPEIKNIASESGIMKIGNFGFLSIYDTGFVPEDVFAPATYSKVNANFSYASQDPIYQNVGDYVNGDGLLYPFVNLDKRSGVEISITDNEIKFKNSQFNAEGNLPIEDTITTDLTINQGFDEAFNCDLRQIGVVSKEITPSGVLYKATSGGASCDYVSFPVLEYSQGYMFHITGENRFGRSLKIYLFDSVSQNPVLEEILPVGKFDENYFIYPRDLEGAGYILNFETRSFGRIASENLISNIEFYPVDYDYLTSYQSGASGVPEKIKNNLQIESVKKYGTWGYKVGTSGEGLLALGQGYEEGWKAFQIENKKLQFLTHLKMNSWANAWQVENPSTIYIVFWPQALEWGGMVAGLITLLVIILKRSKDC